MEALSANEAKTQFGDLLLKAQQAPVQINKNGKPVAVVISMLEYEQMEAFKLTALLSRADAAKGHIASENTVDGESFFDELATGCHDKEE